MIRLEPGMTYAADPRRDEFEPRTQTTRQISDGVHDRTRYTS
jgi:hypothetical protein